MKKYKYIILIFITIMLIIGTIIFVIVSNSYSRCNINLSDGTNTCNLSIDNDKILVNETGKYYLEGMTDQYSVEVTSNSDVTFILNNVVMKNVTTAFNILSNVDVTFIINEDTKLYGSIESLGNIYINGDGILEVTSDESNIKSEKNIIFEGITINTRSKRNSIKSDEKIEIINSNINIITEGNFIEDNKEGRYLFVDGNYIKQPKTDLENKKLYSLENSAKGIKAKDLIIRESVIDINSTDDTINVDNIVDISNSKLKLNTRDDAITSKKGIYLINNSIEVLSAFEGFESSEIIIDNGNYLINSSNDGINVKSEGDNTYCSACSLLIKNGNINLNVGGDGIDVDGTTTIDDGNIYISSGDDGIQSTKTIFNGGITTVLVNVLGNSGIISAVKYNSGFVFVAQKDDTFINNSVKYLEYNNTITLLDEDKNVFFEVELLDKYDYLYIYTNNKLYQFIDGLLNEII